MEGDVESILPRPTLPPSSPDPSSTTALSRYASRDLRTRETQAEIEKWDAWHACAGMSRTEAKRRYISTLIETMKVYASGTAESRELVGELEFVWGQIRSQSGSSEDDEASPGEQERRLERAGLKTMDSCASIPGESPGPDGREGRVEYARDGGRLRVLSPVSRGGSGEIIEGEDRELPHVEEVFEDDGEEDADLDQKRPNTGTTEDNDYTIRNRKWRRSIESALTKMTAEIAALRENMEDSRIFVRRRTGVIAWLRWLAMSVVRQLLTNAALLLLLVLWGRWKEDTRAEEWLRRRWKGMRALLETLDLRSRVGLPAFITSRISHT
jgi:Acyl CoA binding protein